MTTPASQLAPGSGFAFGQTSGTTSTAGAHTHTTDSQGFHAHSVGTNPAGGHTHTASIAGGGTRLDIRNPLLAATKIIFCGVPGETRQAAAPAATRLLRSPMRGMN